MVGIFASLSAGPTWLPVAETSDAVVSVLTGSEW